MKDAAWRARLKDANFRRWHDNLAQGSTGTADERARILHRYLRQHRMTPRQFVTKAKRNRRSVEDQLQDFLVDQQKRGRSPSYVKNYVTAVKSWLEFNEVRLVRKFRIRDAGATPTLEDERVPTKEELKSILSAASARGRVIIAFVAFSGLRPEVLGNNEGTDGLRVKDLAEMQVAGKAITFTQIPTRVVVRRTLSKARHRYATFLPAEGCDYLQAYLEGRVAIGEGLEADSPIVTAAPGYERMGRTGTSYDSPFIVSRNITREIRRAMRPRFDWRPYVLRAYFDTQMLLAESHGKMNRDYRQFFMGHKGDVEHSYTVRKGRLPAAMVEDMRRRFSESEPFLTTVATHVADVKQMLLETFREQARAYGIDPLKVRIEKQKAGARVSPDNEIRLLTLEIARRTAPQTLAAGTTFTNGQGRKNRVVKGERQLVRDLDRGWELVASLGHDRFLVRQNPT